MNTLSTLMCSTLILAFSANGFAAEAKTPYPNDYRQWFHVKSMLIEPGHALANPFQGIHHVYANDKAVQGLKTGNYSNGAILVFDLLNYSAKDHSIQESERKLIGVMHRDSKKFAATGGWGFEGFAGNSKNERLTNDGGAGCFACHEPQKDQGYVFSTLRE